MIDLAEIPRGEIILNDNRIKKKWTVTVDRFMMGKYPVTQELFFRIMGTSPSTFIGANLPVESISWTEAVLFCNRLSEELGLTSCYKFSELGEKVTCFKEHNGYRLPTEAEWQYACQANTANIRYGELSEIAWFKDNSDHRTHEVGLKKPNKWGLYDMLGNIWEWCNDIYDEEVYGTYRIIRGGGWSDLARSVMATNRRRSHPSEFRIDDLGFRVAKGLRNAADIL